MQLADRVRDAAKGSRRHVDSSGNILTDDELMKPLYALANRGTLDAATLKDLAGSLPPPGATQAEETTARAADIETEAFTKLLRVPSTLKNKFRIMDDDVDHLAFSGARWLAQWARLTRSTPYSSPPGLCTPLTRRCRA